MEKTPKETKLKTSHLTTISYDDACSFSANIMKENISFFPADFHMFVFQITIMLLFAFRHLPQKRIANKKA